MSDSQVLEYVKDGIRQGKEQKQLASELARRGVTKEQATRVKQLYEQQNNVNVSNATGTDINESRLREEMKENTSDMLEDHPSTQDLARGNQVFGRNIFNTRNLTFEPSVNIATPLNLSLIHILSTMYLPGVPWYGHPLENQYPVAHICLFDSYKQESRYLFPDINKCYLL